MGMHEIEELEQRFLTPDQLEAKYGSGRKASIMPDAKGTKRAANPTNQRRSQTDGVRVGRVWSVRRRSIEGRPVAAGGASTSA
jgi:hypothetical protein